MADHNDNIDEKGTWHICSHILEGTAADACLGPDHIAVCMPCAIASRDKLDILYPVSPDILQACLEKIDTIIGVEYLHPDGMPEKKDPADANGEKPCGQTNRQTRDLSGKPAKRHVADPSYRCDCPQSWKACHHRDFGHLQTIFEKYGIFLKPIRARRPSTGHRICGFYNSPFHLLC